MVACFNYYFYKKSPANECFESVHIQYILDGLINCNAFKVLAQQLKNLTDLFFVFMLVLKYFKLVFLVKVPCTWLQAQPCLKIKLSFPVQFVLELT